MEGERRFIKMCRGFAVSIRATGLEDRNMKPVILVLTAASLTLFMAGHAQADITGYVGHYQEVYLTDFTSTTTLLGLSGIADIRALDTEPASGILYAADDDGQLWTVDTGTGVGTLIGNMGRRIDSISFAPDGTLYALYEEALLRRIDTSTAVATTIGSRWPYHITAFAVDSNGSAIGWDHDTSSLIAIDLTDGSTTSLGALSGHFDAFDYGPDGRLYGYRAELGTLYSVDIDSLTFTYEGSSVLGRAMAVVPVPIPSAVLLGTVGLAYAAWRLRIQA